MKAIALFFLLVTPAYALNIFKGGVFSPASESVPPGITLQSLMALSSDRDSTMANLSLMVDDKNLVAGMFASAIKTKKSRPADSGKVFWMRDIESRSGAVLVRAQNRDILILQGKLDRETQQGKFRLRYLANGLTGRYENCDFNLRRAHDGDWWIQNSYTQQKVTLAHLITWKLGVKTIQGLCPAQ